MAYHSNVKLPKCLKFDLLGEKKKRVLTKTVRIKVNQTGKFNAVNFVFSGYSLAPIFISKKDKCGKQNNNII